MKTTKLNIGYLIYLICIVLFFLSTAEFICVSLLNNPSLINGTSIIKPFRTYYKNYDRNIIQLMPTSSRYDSNYSYTLRPGRSEFSNREFKNIFYINSLGVRDNEISLSNPDVILLGDSHAMGWGVEQDSTFASMLETESNYVVLNAAVSSYGTVRQLKMLEKIDTSNLKYLLIQYCENDYLENQRFIKTFNLPIIKRSKYDSLVVQHEKSRNYFFGKHSALMFKVLLNGLVRRLNNENSKTVSIEDEVTAFLEILNYYSAITNGCNIIIFEINEFARNDKIFISELKKRIEIVKYKSIGNNIIVCDLSDKLSQTHYFPLDGHMTAKGHKIVVNEILHYF